jgi:hypothetical protein
MPRVPRRRCADIPSTRRVGETVSRPAKRCVGGPRWSTPFGQAAGAHGVARVDGTGTVAFDATTRDAASPDATP